MRSSSATTIWASSTSWCSIASSVRCRDALTRTRPSRALASSVSSSTWYSCRAADPGKARTSRSTEATADVILGRFLVGVGEDRLRLPDLDQPARLAGLLEVEKGGDVAVPGRLLHVVG